MLKVVNQWGILKTAPKAKIQEMVILALLMVLNEVALWGLMML